MYPDYLSCIEFYIVLPSLILDGYYRIRYRRNILKQRKSTIEMPCHPQAVLTVLLFSITYPSSASEASWLFYIRKQSNTFPAHSSPLISGHHLITDSASGRKYQIFYTSNFISFSANPVYRSCSSVLSIIPFIICIMLCLSLSSPTMTTRLLALVTAV